MDLNSLNSGPISEKGWLNPICNAIKAKSVGAASYQITDEESQDTVQLSGGIYRRAAGASPVYSLTDSPAPFGAGMVDLITSNTTEGGIPLNALVGGCSYELYFAGRFTDATPANIGAVYAYPSFTTVQPTDFPQTMCEIIIDSAPAAGVQSFEVRVIFRILAYSDTSIIYELTWNSAMNRAAIPSEFRMITNPLEGTVSTPSRAAQVDKRLPFTLWARSVGGPISLARTQLYLRRIS
jgi:hypothetical protein